MLEALKAIEAIPYSPNVQILDKGNFIGATNRVRQAIERAEAQWYRAWESVARNGAGSRSRENQEVPCSIHGPRKFLKGG